MLLHCILSNAGVGDRARQRGAYFRVGWNEMSILYYMSKVLYTIWWAQPRALPWIIQSRDSCDLRRAETPADKRHRCGHYGLPPRTQTKYHGQHLCSVVLNQDRKHTERRHISHSSISPAWPLRTSCLRPCITPQLSGQEEYPCSIQRWGDEVLLAVSEREKVIIYFNVNINHECASVMAKCTSLVDLFFADICSKQNKN